MAHAVCLDRPSVLRFEQVEVGDLGPGEARVGHAYVVVKSAQDHRRTVLVP